VCLHLYIISISGGTSDGEAAINPIRPGALKYHRQPALEVQAQCLVQRLPMMPGIGLQITGAAAVTENAEHRRQQTGNTADKASRRGPTIGDRLEEADQSIRYVLIY